MLALFSPPVLLFDKCAFVCTLIQYISRFATCQANFSCKLRETQRKFQPATGYLYPSRWLGLSDDVATATTEMERQRNRSSLARWMGILMMWRQPRLRWSAAESKLRFSVLCLNLSVRVATAILPCSVSGIEVAVLLHPHLTGSPTSIRFPSNHRSALLFLYTTFFTPAAPLL